MKKFKTCFRNKGCRWIALNMACLLAMVSLPAGAQILTYGSSQTGFGLKIYQVESALYPYVAAYVRTFNEERLPLVNLNQANIGLLVNGRSYNPGKGKYFIDQIVNRPEGVRTVFVIDTSATMAGAPFESALEATARFIDAKRKQDQVAIIALEDNKQGYNFISKFENDPVLLGNRLADLRADGKVSRIYDAIGAALQLALSASSNNSRDVAAYMTHTSIVVLSDGEDNNSAITRQDLMSRISNASIPIPIHGVSYSSREPKHLGNLQALSFNSFGKFYELAEAHNQMTQVLEEIHSIATSDYVVTFKACNPVDGNFHPFKIGVEYPARSGSVSYDSSHFEAIQLPNYKDIVALREKIKERMNDTDAEGVCDPH